MTAEQKQWLCEHYADTKNDDILAYLGVSMTAMQRIKRSLGLHKSAEYMRKAQQHAVACSVKVTKGRPRPHLCTLLPAQTRLPCRPGCQRGVLRCSHTPWQAHRAVGKESEY